MSTPTGPHVDTAIATLRGELARSDSKASLLLALTGAGLLALISLGAGGGISAPAVAAGAVAATAFLAATLVLLLAVRPSLGGRGWPTWPDLSPADLHEHLQGQHIDEVRVLATTARTKFRRIRLAIDLLVCGLAALALSAGLAALV